MSTVAVSPVVRAILAQNLDQAADDVIRKARAKGVTAPDNSVRDSIYNIKSELRKKAAKAALNGAVPKLVPAAAQQTKAPTPAPETVAEPVVVYAPAPVLSSSAPSLSAMLANVALVNNLLNVCGGIEPARKMAEVVKACGGVEAFLQHLELVAGIRGGTEA